MTTKPSYLNFSNKTYAWKANIDYRKHPELYQVGKGEQGVLICQPYKSEILPFWKFKTLSVARVSCKKILALFYAYLKINDFVGADLARKFLQMGYTRSRRYANYRGGKKYDKENNYKLLEKGTGSAEKAESALVFYMGWKKAEATLKYAEAKKAWKAKYG